MFKLPFIQLLSIYTTIEARCRCLFHVVAQRSGSGRCDLQVSAERGFSVSMSDLTHFVLPGSVVFDIETESSVLFSIEFVGGAPHLSTSAS